jgi:hypothetical protein
LWRVKGGGLRVEGWGFGIVGSRVYLGCWIQHTMMGWDAEGKKAVEVDFVLE